MSIELPKDKPKAKEKYKIAIVETSDAVEAEARDVAEAKMTKSKEQLKGFSGFVKKIWTHNLMNPYYRQRQIAIAKGLILENENLYADTLPADDAAHKAAMKSIVDRFASEYEETVHTEAGEIKEKLGEGSVEIDIKQHIRELIEAYAEGSINETIFNNEKNRLFSRIKGEKRNVIDKGVMYADNLLEIAKQVKQNVDHGQRLEEMDLDFEVIVGRAKAGVRTEAQFTLCDKITDKIQRSPVGHLINETTIASAVAIAWSLSSSLSEKLATSAAFQWGSFGATALFGAGIAAAREAHRLEEERRQHFRDIARGKTFDPDTAPRRRQMEEYRYQTMTAIELLDGLNATMPGTEHYTMDNFNRAVANLAEIESRIKLSDKNKIDLIAYSDEKAVENERLQLDIARAKAKVELRRMVEDGRITLPNGTSFDDYLAGHTNTRIENMTSGDQGIEQKNALFRKMKTKRVAITALKGLAAGLVIGGVIQEVGAFFKEGQVGFVEGLLKGQDKIPTGTVHYTPLEYLRRYFVGDLNQIKAPTGWHEILIGSNHIKLPDGVDLVKNVDGTYDLLAGKRLLGDNLQFNPDGTLTQQAKDILQKAGIPLHASVEHVTTTTTQQITSKTDDYIKHHKELFDKTNRALWYDNDTPAPVFDKNELGLWWGGHENTGIDAQGKYVFNIKSMTEWGSYHEGFSVEAQNAMKSGKLMMLFSLSEGSQDFTVSVPIDANGNAIIDPSSEIGKLFFSKVDGHAVFNGRFAEVAQILDIKPDGEKVVRLLATHEGNGLSSLPDIIPNTIITDIPRTALDVKFPPDVSGAVYDLPPVIPILGREPLEKIIIKNNDIAYYLSGYGQIDENLKQEFFLRRAQTLKKDPDARLNHYDESEKYIKQLDKKYRMHIEKLSRNVESMDKDTKLSICIPVAGHQEGNKIYNTLKNYTYQTANKKSFEIFLYINHPKTDKNEKTIKPDNTIKEIERFRKEYPDIKVRMVYDILPIEKAKIGYVRKVLNDLVLYRHHKRGKNVDDLIMVSNDADNLGIAPEYVDNFIDKFQNEKVDGMLGQLDWDPEAYAKYPAVHIGTRLFQYLSVIGRKRSGRMVSSGANFAFKSSIYAGIGGYLDYLPGGEDVNIGRAIAEARKNPEYIQFAGARKSRVYTSARRAVSAVKAGLPPIQQWTKGFSAFDDEIRRYELEQDMLVDYNDPKVVEKLKSDLEKFINLTLSEYESGEKLGKGHPFYRKAIGLLGIKYALDNQGDIVITNISSLINTLKKYQEYGVLLRDIKSGKVEYKKAFAKIRMEQRKADEEIMLAQKANFNQIRKKYKEHLKQFNKTNVLSFGSFVKGLDKNFINDSKDWKKIANYSVSMDKILSDQETGIVYAGYSDDGPKDLLVIKENPKELFDLNNKLNDIPNEVESVEKYLEYNKFNHKNVLMPSDFFEHDGKIFRVYQAGKMDLEKYFENEHKLTLKNILSMIINLNTGIENLHKNNIVHGDISPSNIILDENKIMISDLDGAMIMNSNGICRRKFVRGNRFSMPPEMFQSDNNSMVYFDKTSDIYQVSALLYRSVMNKWPYVIDNDKVLSVEQRFNEYKKLHISGNIRFDNTVPIEIQHIIIKGMNPDPAQRYQSMEEMQIDLIEYYNRIK